VWLLAVDCKCPALPEIPQQSNGPLQDTPPGDLAARGLVLDQPGSGSLARGAWLTVAGWVDPAAVQDVLVMGAPKPGFYLPTGHVGVPTVPVRVRRDGRFFAPRVPLEDGVNTIRVIAVARGGATYQPVERQVTATDTANIPATLVAIPAQPEPGAPVTFRAATGESANLSWQWDVDGDGVFDQEGTSATHTYAQAGHVDVTARTLVNGSWWCASTRLDVGRLPDVVASSTAVTAPRRVFVVPRFAALPLPVDAEGNLDPAATATRYVAVLDGDGVKVFDGALALLFTLEGLSRPSFVAGDVEGRLYVADTGNNRVARFLASGALDVLFGTQGSFRGSTELPVTAPVGLLVGPGQAAVYLEDGTVLTCAGRRVTMADTGLLLDWTAVDCDSHTLTGESGYAELGLTGPPAFVSRPSLFFDDQGLRPAYLMAQGALSAMELGGFGVKREGVVDVALGRTTFLGDSLEVTPDGKVVTRARGMRTGVYTLPYAVTAVGAGPNGVVVLAGAGRLETRGFEVLR